MKKISRALCFLALGLGVMASSNAQVASKKLVVYCPHPLVFIEPIVKKFEAATGIQTEVVAAGTGELLKRIEAESANPLGDVMWGGSKSTLEPSKKFFESYHSPEEAAFFDDIRDMNRYAHSLTSFDLLGGQVRRSADTAQKLDIQSA